MDKAIFLINMVLRHEGGFVDDPNDSGGFTYRGISRRYNPDWAGWDIVDAHLPLKYNQIIDDAELENLVIQKYEESYYLPLKIDQVDSLMISAHLMCHGVNAGLSSAAKLIQRSVNEVYGAGISVDGVLGNASLEYINNPEKEQELVDVFIEKRKEFYRNIVERKPSQEKFLNGWLNRVDGTTETVLAAQNNVGGDQTILYADTDFRGGYGYGMGRGGGAFMQVIMGLIQLITRLFRRR